MSKKTVKSAAKQSKSHMEENKAMLDMLCDQLSAVGASDTALDEWREAQLKAAGLMEAIMDSIGDKAKDMLGSGEDIDWDDEVPDTKVKAKAKRKSCGGCAPHSGGCSCK